MVKTSGCNVVHCAAVFSVPSGLLFLMFVRFPAAELKQHEAAAASLVIVLQCLTV